MIKKMDTEFGIARLDKGYWRINSEKEGNLGKLLHRLIYEKYYGKIPKGYVIHHKDGNKVNNDISNLEMIEASKHNKFHMLGKKNPFYGKKLPKKTRIKMSKSHSGYNHHFANYTLWDINNVHFNKSYFNKNNPLKKSFKVKYNGKQLPIGTFNEFVSCEIIHQFIKEGSNEF